MIGLLWSGIVTGSLYALGALGLVLIFKSTKVVNFAFGNQAGVAAFAVFALVADRAELPWGLGVLIACFVGLALAAVLCVLVYPIALRSDIGAVIATLGLGLILQGVTMAIFGTSVASLDLPLPSGIFWVGGVPVTIYDLAVVGVAAFLIVVLYLVIERSRIGIAFRAVSHNPEASQICGLSLLAVHIGSWLAASVLALVAALLIVPTTYLSPVTVPTFMLSAFIAAAIGGFESLPGAVLGGMTVGVSVNLFNYYVSPEFANSFIVLLVLVLLTIFPGGFLSKRETRRV